MTDQQRVHLEILAAILSASELHANASNVFAYNA